GEWTPAGAGPWCRCCTAPPAPGRSCRSSDPSACWPCPARAAASRAQPPSLPPAYSARASALPALFHGILSGVSPWGLLCVPDRYLPPSARPHHFAHPDQRIRGEQVILLCGATEQYPEDEQPKYQSQGEADGEDIQLRRRAHHHPKRQIDDQQ